VISELRNGNHEKDNWTIYSDVTTLAVKDAKFFSLLKIPKFAML